MHENSGFSFVCITGLLDCKNVVAVADVVIDKGERTQINEQFDVARMNYEYLFIVFDVRCVPYS